MASSPYSPCSRAPHSFLWVPPIANVVAAAALFGVISTPAPLPWPPPLAWSLSRRAGNRLQHALNGNPLPGVPRPRGSHSDWQTVGRVDGKLLSEPQTAAKLRSVGWSLPAALPADYMVRVYDTRLEEGWLRDLATELVGIDVDSLVVGGDFLTSPHLEDGPAFHAGSIQR